jgi:hypothetical protein
MSEDLVLKARFEAENNASPIIQKLKHDVDALGTSIRKAFLNGPSADFLKSMQSAAAQYAAITTNVARQTAEMQKSRSALRSLTGDMAKAARAESSLAGASARRHRDGLTFARARLAFGLRMSRQRAQEERQAETAHRANIRRLESERAVAGRRMGRSARDAFGDTGRGLGRSTRSAGFAAAAGVGVTALAARRVLSAEVDMDAASVNSQIYGKLSRQAAVDLRKAWAGPLSESLGVTTADLLKSYVEAIKVGIPDGGAKAFSELATKASEAWDVDFGSVTESLGTINTLLTSAGAAFSIDRLQSVANGIQHLSAKMATTPTKMISFMRRGAGASQLLGMSQEAGLAFGAASTSLGNEAFASGRMFDYIAGRITELPKIMRGRGEESRQASQLLQSLGYGSMAGLRTQQRKDPDGFVFDFVSRFARIKDQTKRNEAIRFFTGQEWLGEFGRMVTGMDTVREAQSLAREAKGFDAIGEVWELHKTKLLFTFKQFRAGFLNILGELGMVMSPLARQAGDYFLKGAAELRSGGLQARFTAAIEGAIEGFGFRNLTDLLQGIFGKPGEGIASTVETWRKAARGFAQGLRDIADMISTGLRALAGPGGDAEAMSLWAARILGFSAAARLAQPAFDLLGGFATALIGLANGILSLAVLGRIAGLTAVLGGGAVAGAAGAGLLTFALAGVAAGLVLSVAIVNWDKFKEAGGAVGDFWDYFRSGPKDEKQRQAIDDAKSKQRNGFSLLADWFNELFGIKGVKAGELPPGYRNINPTSSTGSGERAQNALITQSASIGRLNDSIGQMGARFQTAAFGSPAISGFGGGGGGGSVSGIVGGSLGGGRIGNGPINTFGMGSGIIRRDFGGSTFATKAPGIMAQLQKDFGLTKEQAAGIVGNLGHESGGFQKMQELNPRGGGRGGFGWAQWTGPRRKAFEAWSAANGLDPRSDAANYGFLRHELMGSERGALAAVRGQSTAQGATVAFERSYERAGVKHYGSRMAYADRALSLSNGGTDANLAGLASGMIPVKDSSGRTVMMDPKAGFGQAFAGGQTSAGVLAAAQAVAKGGIAGGLDRFTGFNDNFHAGRNSKHAIGLAGDVTIKDPSQSAQAAEDLRKRFRAAGLSDEAFKVIDEYKNPSGHATAGHLHYQFANQEAAAKYAAFMQANSSTLDRTKALGYVGRPGGYQGSPNPAGLASGVPTPQSITQGVPVTSTPASSGGGASPAARGAGSGSPVTIMIQGGNHDAEALATQVQRRVTEAMNWQTHDSESQYG